MLHMLVNTFSTITYMSCSSDDAVSRCEGERRVDQGKRWSPWYDLLTVENGVKQIKHTTLNVLLFHCSTWRLSRRADELHAARLPRAGPGLQAATGETQVPQAAADREV